MGQQGSSLFSSVHKLNFEDMLDILKEREKSVLPLSSTRSISLSSWMIINTLPQSNQDCLIKHTLTADQEIEYINHICKEDQTNISKYKIVIYGMNSMDYKPYEKYEQLYHLGFRELFIYTGGLFEWLLLQDIYSDDLFKTTKKELDILKYKGHSSSHSSHISSLPLTNPTNTTTTNSSSSTSSISSILHYLLTN
jgi:hypothetical protein